MGTQTKPRDRLFGAVLAALVVLVFVIFLFHPPTALSMAALSIIRFLAALCGGLSAFLFIGGMHLSGELPLRATRLQVKAGGAFAMFVLILLIFFWGVPVPETVQQSPRTPLLVDPRDTAPSSETGMPPGRADGRESAGGLPTPLPVSDHPGDSFLSPRKAKQVRVLQLLEGNVPTESNGEVSRSVTGQRATINSNRFFDLTLSNSGATQVVFTKFALKWRYRQGSLASPDHGEALIPTQAYTIDLPVSSKSEALQRKRQLIYPSLLLPPANASGPSIMTIRLQLHYTLVGEVQYHPCADWDIQFELALANVEGEQVIILPWQSWRHPRA